VGTKNEEQNPSNLNHEAINRFRSRKKRSLSVEEYVEGIHRGNRTILSRAITMVESSKPEHRETAQQIIEACLPDTGNSIRLGITGVPGVGKSTFIEAFGNHIIQKGRRLAVMAIDPTSSRSKGSILGDKTRMETLANNPDAFIRPSPTGGSLGGVARKTRETILLCEAAGFDTIIIETVGVGQSETTVHSMVDFFLLLVLAGAGDELQGMKRGIVEMSDLIAVNKADNGNIDKAKMAAREYRNALHLYPPTQSGWEPQVTTCSALKNEGVDDIWDTITQYITTTRENGYFVANRRQQARQWMYETIDQRMRDDFYNNSKVNKRLKSLEKQVIRGQKSPFRAAQELLKLYE